jgi:uncharacterized membrane protein
VLSGRIAVDAVAIGVAALAVWRLAHFLYAEEGPWDIAVRLRRAFPAQLSGLLRCFFCLSVWPALPAALLVATGWREFVLLWPALSAAAVLLERLAFPDTFVGAPEFMEEKETQDVLRQSETDFDNPEA